jgi:hypothetical protein
MPRYQDDTLQFDVPRDWQDRTIVAFAAPAQPDQDRTSNLVMTREPLGETENLASYAERHLLGLSERLDGFELVGRESRPVGDRMAMVARFRSGDEDGGLEQLLYMVELPRRVVASFTLTAPEEDAEQILPLFERILSTVRVSGAGRRTDGLP